MIRKNLFRLFTIILLLFLTHFLAFIYAANTQAHHAPLPPSSEQSVFNQYGDYVRNAVHLDLGQMPNSHETILHRILVTTQASLAVLLLAFGLSIPLGIALGFRAAHWESYSVSRWLAPLTTAGFAMPGFYLGSLVIVGSILYVRWGGPQAHIPLPLQGFGYDQHIILPVLVLMVRPTMQIAQTTANLLVHEFNQLYVQAARSFGHSRRNIRNRLVFRNILVPVIVSIVGTFRQTIGQLIIVEWLFAWPGLGRLLVILLVYERSFLSVSTSLFSNPPLVAADITVLAGIFLLGDYVGALLRQKADPRLNILPEQAAQ